MVINEALINAKNILKQNGIDEREARLLLAFSLNLSFDKLIIKKDITKAEYEKYLKIVNKRAMRNSICIHSRKKRIYEINV